MLTFHSDGRITGLYTEAIDLHRLGRLHVERFTTIEFSDEQQQWCVNDTSGRTLYSHPSRQQCLSWEHQHFNQQKKEKSVERRWELPLPEFLEWCGLVKRFAENQNMSVEEMLVDGMIANRLESETYGQWLARQVHEVLCIQCEHDNWRACDEGRLAVSSNCDLEQMSFSPEDRHWIVETFGDRADVQALWATVCQQQPLAMAA